MEFTIKPRKHKQAGEFCFWMPDNGGYIYLQSAGRSGTLGRQICAGGGFMGDTLSGANDVHFKYVCRRWYRQYMRADCGAYI